MEMHNTYTDGVGANPVNAVETVCVTLPGITTPPATLVVLEAVACLTTGATTTAIVARIRRGTTIAGTLIGAAFTLQSAAAVLNTVAAQVADTPGDVANQPYVLTLQQTGGTANGAVTWASLQATWLS